jgi:hypothetical protein
VKLKSLGKVWLSFRTLSKLKGTLEWEELYMMGEAAHHWLCKYSSSSALDPLKKVLRAFSLQVERSSLTRANFKALGIVGACMKRGKAHALRFKNDGGLALQFLLFLRQCIRKDVVATAEYDGIFQLCVHALNVHPLHFSPHIPFLDLLEDVYLHVNASNVLSVAGAEICGLVHWKSESQSGIQGRAFNIMRHLLVEISISREGASANAALPGEAERGVQ